MSAVRFLFGRFGGKIQIGSKVQLISPNSIVVTHHDIVLCSPNSDLQSFEFYPADFQQLYTDVVELLDVKHGRMFWRTPIRTIKAQEEVIVALELLAKGTPTALLYFAYIYCLGVDRRYFSALLQQIMSGDKLFFDYIEANALNQWSAARYALELNIPLNKFNLLFQEKYGSSAKRWLLERRLTHARELLLSTPMRVLDIALECGFSNHGHFNQSFRKRYLCNPTQFRLRMQAYK